MGNQYTAGLPPGGLETTELPYGGRVELTRPKGGEDYVHVYHVKVIDSSGKVLIRRVFTGRHALYRARNFIRKTIKQHKGK